jgi:hypothetical protein
MEKGELESALYWLPLIKTAKFWAGVLVGIGIAGEVIGDRLAAPREALVEKARETQLVQLQKDTADAQAIAAEANLALAKLRTPRTLTPEQQERIVSAMRPYFGQPFALSAAPDPEARELVKAIGASLLAAKWQPGMPREAILSGAVALATGRGVEIEWHSGCSQQTSDIGTLLADVLKEQGIAATANPTDRTHLLVNVIGIRVGTKPE